MAPTCRLNRVTGDDSPFLPLSITARLMARPPFHVEPIGGASRREQRTDVAEEGACVRYRKLDRIPAVVRRPVTALAGISLLDLVARGDTRTVLNACIDIFSFKQAVGSS